MSKCDICGKKIYVDEQIGADPLEFERYHTWACGSKYDTTYLRFELCPDCYDKILSKIILQLNSVKECVDSLHGGKITLEELKQYAKHLLEKEDSKNEN